MRRVVGRARARLRDVAYNAGYRLAGSTDGYALPPARLLRRATGTGQIAWYQLGGMHAHEAIVRLLRKHGVPVERLTRVLDFGCGCGRLIRHWASLRKTCELWGCDDDPALIEWCRRKLADVARFQVNRPDPPLDVPDESFDLVYSASVFTQFAAERQRPWVTELARVLRPGGWLLLTVHGMSNAIRDGLSSDRLGLLERGALVVDRTGAYHSEGFVRQELAQGLEVADVVPRGMADGSEEDVYLIRKPVRSPSGGTRAPHVVVLAAGSEASQTVSPGDICRMPLPAAGPDVRRRVFLTHRRILYPQPISDAPAPDVIELCPEGPGRYVLAVQSIDPGGTVGWTEARFEVPGATDAPGPRLVTIDDQTSVWVPTAWEARVIAGHERAALWQLRELVVPGAVVYDIGAHVGLYAIALARLVGPTGHVYCVEADPLCVYFLSANLDTNRVENADVLPVALVDRAGSTELTVNYHNLLVGMVKDAGFAFKAGHRITVPAAGLDELIASHRLRPPTLVKMDIEGAEVLAIEGMRQTIAAHRPVLFVELHGRDAARKTLQSLAGAGYQYLETASGRRFPDADSLSEWFPDAVLQVIAQPGPAR